MAKKFSRQVYLNNAATAWPKAPGVVEAIQTAIEETPLSEGRTTQTGHCWIRESRTRLAQLIGATDDNQIVLTPNATVALNLAILGLSLCEGDEVVTSVSEHNSLLRPLAHLENRCGIKIHKIDFTENGFLDEVAFAQALERRPRLVAFNHASNVTGRVQPIVEYFRLARDAGTITLLDASQSLGHIPVNASSLGADLIAFTGHKALRGPQGTGGLFVSPAIELEQIVVGGTGVRSNLRRHPVDMPARLEAGTANFPGFAGLTAALRWLEVRDSAFMAREKYLTKRLRNELRQIPGVRVLDDSEDVERLPIVSIVIDDWSPSDIGQMLQNGFGIVCRTGLHCAPDIHRSIGSDRLGTVRMSPSGATTDEDIDYTINAFWEIFS